MGLKYITFISGSGFYSGGFHRTSSYNHFRYVGVGKDYHTIYDVYNTGLTLNVNKNIFGVATPTTYVGSFQQGGGSYVLGGEYTDGIQYTITDTYSSYFDNRFDTYLAYHAPYKYNRAFGETYFVYIISDTNKSGLVTYKETYSHSSGGVSYVDLTYTDKLDYSSTLTTPGSQLLANSLILVNDYLIGGFSDVGLMSFTMATNGSLTQKDRISGGTNDYIQAVANYGNYLYFTTAGSSNSGSLRRCELTGTGTFSGLTTIVSTGTTAAAITIKDKYLYYGSQMELHKYEINPSNGNLTHKQTYDLTTDHFTNAIIRNITIDTDTDYMVLETSEGRAFILEEGEPITAGSKNRVIFIM